MHGPNAFQLEENGRGAVSVVLITGTHPSSRRGGIGFALPGYLRALDCENIAWISVPTYYPSTLGGKWYPWLAAFLKLRRQIMQAHKRGQRVTVYSHAGAGISLLREGLILAFCRAWGSSTVMQLHAPEIDDYLAHPLKRWFLRRAVSSAMALGVLTPWWRRRLLDGGIDKPSFVIPNPLPAEWEEVAQKPRMPRTGDGKIVLLSLSRLVPGKGVDYVIEAIPFLPDGFELVVAGDGRLRDSMEQRVAALGIAGRVRFTGWVSGEAKQRLFDEADVFVLPSLYDSFGMGFLEAMANGLPVVAAEWGAIADVVPAERCGVLVSDPNPQALSKAILRMSDAEQRRLMGTEAKRWVLEKFAPSVVGRDIKGMLETVANE